MIALLPAFIPQNRVLAEDNKTVNIVFIIYRIKKLKKGIKK